MFDKTKSCNGCPDRTADPNCHSNCEGYKLRQQVQEEKYKKRKMMVSNKTPKGYKENIKY